MEGIYKRKSFPSKRLIYNKLTLYCAFYLNQMQPLLRSIRILFQKQLSLTVYLFSFNSKKGHLTRWPFVVVLNFSECYAKIPFRILEITRVFQFQHNLIVVEECSHL